MSFSKAKITRFNEKTTCTPSPADYNVLIKNNATGAVISKTERFVEPKTPALSEDDSCASANTAPCFRTPTQPKKKKNIFNLSGRKTKPTDLFNKSTSDSEALKDKIVECNNKDLFIKDLTEQIEEMKMQLSNLEKQKTQLIADKNKFEGISIELKEEHRIALQSIYLEHDREEIELKNKLNKSEEQLLRAKEEFRMLKNEKEHVENQFKAEVSNLTKTHSAELEEIQKRIEANEIILTENENRIKVLEDNLSILKQKHSKELNELNEKHKNDLLELKINMLKRVSEVEKMLDAEKKNYENHLEELQQKFKQDKLKMLEESEAKIKQIEENCKEANLLADIQMQQKYQDVELTWKIKLENQAKEADAILKECQAISEYSITQCEWEKKEINDKLVNKIEELNTLQKQNEDLIIAHTKLEIHCIDLANQVKDLNHLQTTREESEKAQKELQELLQHKKLYEISINKTHETIETLKKRLLDSDRDVEQLKGELESCELSKLEYEGKYNQLTEELEVVGRINDDLELQIDNTIKLADERISKIETELLNKVEQFKDAAQQEIDLIEKKLILKEAELAETSQLLHAQQNVNSQAQALISLAQKEIAEKEMEVQQLKDILTQAQQAIKSSEIKINYLESNNVKYQENAKLQEIIESCNYKTKEIDNLQRQLQQLEEKSESYSKYCDYYKVKAAEFEKEVMELEGINKKYIEQSGKYDDLLQKYEALEIINANLEKKIAEQVSLIGPFREQLEAYEMEHNALINQKYEAEMEAKNVGLKYAQLLGHQNQKQKIKHIVDLKAKNFELLQNKKELELKLKAQARTIEKLNKQLAATIQSPRKSKLTSTDKENINSPNRTLNNSRVESPGGPLRERN